MKYLKEVPIIGIIRGAETNQVEGAVAAAVQAGLRTVEITLNHPDSIKQISRISAAFPGQIELGAGTVLDVESAREAVQAGAEFIVTPALLPDVIEFCRTRGVPVFPGAMTPTEVLEAHRSGAEMVKVFPAITLGTGYFRSIKGPFPDIRLMAVGGVSAGRAADFFRAGADAVGIGSELFRKEWLAQQDWASIKEVAGIYVEAVKALR